MKKLSLILGGLLVLGLSSHSSGCDNPKKCDFKKGKKTSSEASITPQKELKRTAGSTDAVFTVADMTCGDCESKLEEALNQLKGMQRAVANSETHNISVVFDKSVLAVEQILETIKEAGYSGALSKEGDV